MSNLYALGAKKQDTYLKMHPQAFITNDFSQVSPLAMSGAMQANTLGSDQIKISHGLLLQCTVSKCPVVKLKVGGVF